MPLVLEISIGAFDRGAMAGNHDLAAAIIVGRLHDLLLAFGVQRGLGADLLGLRHVGAEQRRHRALPRRDRLLHGLAAQFQQARGVGDGKRADGAQRAVFAQRMAGGDDRAGFDVDAAFGLQNPQHRERMCHQRRLGVLGQGQFLPRPFEHQFRKLLLQDLIDFLKHLPCRAERGGEVAAHADRLATLAWKDKGVHGHA